MNPKVLSFIVAAIAYGVTLASGFDINGFSTWVWATLIVWVGTIVYDLVDEKAVATAKTHVDRYQQRPGATPPTATPA
ncbi:hypothetical protein NKG05_19490 [Oerskovia sp. M15]